MPIDGPSSYYVVVPLFLNHWADANALDSDILLDHEQCGQEEDVSREALGLLYADLQAARDAVETVLLEAGLKDADVLGHRTWLQAQAVRFNRAVRADHGATKFAANLPMAPQVGEGRERFMKPLRAMKALWTMVNAHRAGLSPAKPALVLEGGATLAAFTARLQAGRTAEDEAEERAQQANLERSERGLLEQAIYPILKVYRLKIAASFAPGSAIVQTLPALTADSEGTPQAGTLAGSFDGATLEAHLAGTPSPTAAVVRHQIRASVGAEPAVGDETVRAEFELGEAIALQTNYGLGAPGAMVHFRLVAITADGHEKGTDWVTIQRPL